MLSKREKYLVVGTIVFASVALFIYFYYFPLKDEIKRLETQSEELSLKLDEAKSLAMKIENTKKEIESVKAEAAENMAILMDTIDEAEVLDYISNKTNYADGSSDISELTAILYEGVSGFNSDKDSEEGLADNLFYYKDITLSFNTNYVNLKDVLKAFETGEKYATLTSLQVKSVEENNLSVPSQDPDSEVPVSTANTSSYPLEIECGLCFYGEQPFWDASGEYTFMEGGNFSKTDLFK